MLISLDSGKGAPAVDKAIIGMLHAGLLEALEFVFVGARQM